MKVQLMGAAQAVTGSCYIVEANGSRFAVDCGMHQGNSTIEKRNHETDAYNASQLSFILLTHAHIDHSGLIPRLVKEGYSGPIYCTEPTNALLGLMLLDSAHIQEMEAEWATRKAMRTGGKAVDPLYTKEDAEKSTTLLQSVLYNTSFEPVPGVRVTYRDAGHILGSAFLELEVTEPEGVTHLVFSGDIGRPGALLMETPSSPAIEADYVFLESTYGDRDHKNEDRSLDELAEAIMYSYERGEKTIIPAFAVERTQEIIYTLFQLHKAGRLPHNLPVYVDSPLAVRATNIFRQHPTYLDKETSALIEAGEDPFALPGLRYVIDVKESQKINEEMGPAVVISASGMCNAGRIKHHLLHNIWRPGASVVFTGYQSVGTPGRKLVDGAKSLNLFGDYISVEAKIFTIGGFSGHAGQSQILDWLDGFDRKGLNVVLVHGEEKAQNILKDLITERFDLPVTIPAYREVLELAPGKLVLQQPVEPVVHRINWNTLFADTEFKIAQLRAQAEAISTRGWEEQTDLREQLLDLNKRLLHMLSQI